MSIGVHPRQPNPLSPSQVPLSRLDRLDDIAEAGVFLASEMARYMTGSAALVDRGAFVNLQ